MTSVTPVITFPDEPGPWLEYLARVTRWTIGARCDAAQLIVGGRFDGRRHTLGVDEVLDGPKDTTSVELDLPQPIGAGAPSRYPVPQEGDQILAFLVEAEDRGSWRPIEAPGAIVVGSAAEDLDTQVAAARWFSSLAVDAVARAAHFSTAIGDARQAVRFTAIRAIGDEGLDPAAPTLLDAAADPSTEPMTSTYAAVALWLLGHHSAAMDAIDGIVRRVGAEQFLALWQVQRSLGDQSETLYGPDPGDRDGS